MRKAFNRLWDVCMTPSIRWYRMPKPEIRYPRYPSPASEPINHEMNHADYKTAFRDSTHQIRYHRDQQVDISSEQYISDPITQTPEEKLVKFGYITPEQKGDSQAVAKAKLQYEADIGEPLDVMYHCDSFGYSDKPITKENRESVAHFVRHFFTATRDRNADEAWMNSMEDIYNPTIFHFKTYDLADEAVFRQLKLDIEWHLELCAQKREKQGYMPVFQATPEFWNALDNSFSPNNIKKIQENLGDQHTDLNETALAIKHNATDIHGKGGRIEYPIRNNLVLN